MEWLARYSEFVSPDAIQKVVTTFKEMYSANNDPAVRDLFIAHKHNSEAVATSISMARNLRARRDGANVDSDTFDQNLAIILSIMEPLLINDANLEFLYGLGMVHDLAEHLFDQPLPTEVHGWKGKAFFKYLLRCLTSALRNEYGVQEFLTSTGNDKYLRRIMRIFEECQEEELVANSAKIIRLVLRDDAFYDRVISSNPQLGNFVFVGMNKHFSSVAVVIESSAAVRNFTRKPAYLSLINTDSLKILVNLLREPKHERSKSMLLSTVKNIVKYPEHERYLKQIGANDILVLASTAQALAGVVTQS